MTVNSMTVNSMTVVKICGITNLDDALAAVDAGADALGFNFYRRSPRYLTAAAARAIIDRLPAELLPVGVFVNEELEVLKETVAAAGIAGVQLHGTESPEYCKALHGHYVIKVFASSGEFKPESVVPYDVPAIMLDAFDRENFGGTGKLSDWASARRVRKVFPQLFLAGGLSPENVGQAIAEVKPYAVDACSRLESEPGRKDQRRMREFVKAVRAASL
ncbi:MAG: phosphoribosylanthranilate isomerase [Pyrinomonadaceae bacterium]|jgi:phosphoribosylanthranilate isomerase|nr:phosphoribosylanthranilate isomerase [Pyrinomonadaceae bacterium]